MLGTRPKRTFSNPKILRLALSMRLKGAEKAQIISAIRNRFYPNHPLETINKAYSPIKGWTRQVVRAVENATPQNKQKVFADAIRLAQKYSKTMHDQNGKLDFKANQKAGASNWLVLAHKEPGFKARTVQRGKTRARQLKADPVIEEKRIKNLKAKWREPDFRQAKENEARVQMTAFQSNKNFIKNRDAALKKLHSDPVFLAKLSAQMVEWNKNPVFRSNVLNGIKHYWAARKTDLRTELERRGISHGFENDGENARIVAVTKNTPVSEIVVREEKDILRKILDKDVPALQREIILMKFGFEGELTDAAIAHKTGLSVTQVQSELASAITILSKNKELKNLLT